MTADNNSAGRVAAIYIAAERGAAVERVEEVEAVAGRGLLGDRYGAGEGSLSKWPGAHRHVTLVALEDLEAGGAETGIDLTRGASRRNIHTNGVNLAALIGRTFRAGGATLRGVQPCAPCGYLERRTAPGVKKALRDRGGLRAEIVESGTIRTGDAIEVIEVP